MIVVYGSQEIGLRGFDHGVGLADTHGTGRRDLHEGHAPVGRMREPYDQTAVLQHAYGAGDRRRMSGHPPAQHVQRAGLPGVRRERRQDEVVEAGESHPSQLGFERSCPFGMQAVGKQEDLRRGGSL
ncbi:hypothetical protein E1285_00775 [Actinomadura sp. 7K507]|nr:hypothetical protein [Actinomadura sp. 7K507]TDC98213.1 hypothetical protein E1285_00775 [Actinomadura sp. 7K507]